MFQIIREEVDEEDTKEYATFASKGLTLKQYTDGQASHSNSHGKLPTHQFTNNKNRPKIMNASAHLQLTQLNAMNQKLKTSKKMS